MYVSSALLIAIGSAFLAGLWGITILLESIDTKIPAQAAVGAAVIPPVFEAPEIEAESAIVYDPNSQTVIYEKNASEQRVLASITKLMTALVSYPFIAAEPTRSVRIEKSDIAAYGDNGLVVDEVWQLDELVKFMLITSSNDAAMTIATSLMPYDEFIAAMNTKSQEIKADLVFTNPSGLDSDNKLIAGATGSARGVALLVAEILRHSPKALESTNIPNLTFKSESGVVHTAKNTNKAIADIPQLIGGKTGFTDLAGGNLAVIVNAGLNRPIIIAVLGSSLEGRFRDTEALASSTLRYFGSK